MTTRRDFLALGSAAAATAFLPSAPASASPLGIPPGLQLWTVKEELAADFTGTLKALGKLGYKRVEAAGWHGRSPKDFRAAVEDAGLSCVSCHHSLKNLIADSEALLALAKEVGVQFCMASSPAPPRTPAPGLEWNRALADAMTLADWRSNAEAMNRIGRQAKALGIRFGFHNHSAEFLSYGGRTAFDELVRLTDPSLVDFQLDIGWVAAAGFDPAQVLKRHARRIRLLHVKDIATKERKRGRIADDMRTTPIGKGTVDWRLVFAAARKAPIHSYFVELEAPFAEPPLTGLAQSLTYLTSLKA